MELVVAAAIIGVIPAMIASRKVARNRGKVFLLWWVYGALFFIVALPHASLWKPDRSTAEAIAVMEGMRKCPHCADMVPEEATVCRSCGRPLPALWVQVLDGNRQLVGTGRRHGTSPEGETVIAVGRRVFEQAAYAEDDDGPIRNVVFIRS